MVFTAQQLITKALYTSGISSRALQTPTFQELSDGLDQLNDILSETIYKTDLQPFWTVYDGVTCVAGQEIYAIPGITAVQSVTFFIDEVRYAMMPATREQYFAYSRVNPIETLPYQWFLNRTASGGDLYLYYVPAQNYPLEIVCKFQDTSLTQFTDLSLTFDKNYLLYLRYKVAAYLCDFYQEPFPPQAAAKLADFERRILNVAPLDFTNRKLSKFQIGNSPDYGQVNLGGGFTVV